MALHEMTFTFPGGAGGFALPTEWSHTGVVGSGDLEILFRRGELSGKVEIQIVTPVRGFDDVWEKVLARFVTDAGLRDVRIQINDNNATPFVVALRLKQALSEAMEGGASS